MTLWGSPSTWGDLTTWDSADLSQPVYAPELALTAWFDETLQPEGWYEEILVHGTGQRALADTPSGTGTAIDATVTTSVSSDKTVAPDTPAATGLSYDATVTASASASVNAEAPTGTGSAYSGTNALGINAESPTGTGTANSVTVSMYPNAGEYDGTGAANSSTTAISVSAADAGATGAGLDATLTISANAPPATDCYLQHHCRCSARHWCCL
jgi:hypothetical protein